MRKSCSRGNMKQEDRNLEMKVLDRSQRCSYAFSRNLGLKMEFRGFPIVPHSSAFPLQPLQCLDPTPYSCPPPAPAGGWETGTTHLIHGLGLEEEMDASGLGPMDLPAHRALVFWPAPCHCVRGQGPFPRRHTVVLLCLQSYKSVIQGWKC